MKRFKAVAILVMFAGIILLLQACTPKNGTPTPIDAEETFSRLLKEVHYAAELEDASEYSEYILNGLPNDVEVRMYLCGGGRADALIMCKASSDSQLPAIRAVLKKYIASSRQNAERYNPSEVSKYDNSVWFESELYIFVCITADTAGVNAVLK